MNAQDLKNSILQLAVQGKLVEQRPEEGSAKELLAQIKAEKEQLIKDRKIKKEKPLPEITDEEKPFEIPESWEWVRIGEICNIVNGFTPKRTNSEYWDNGTIPWFTIEDVRKQGRFIESTEQYITKEALSKNTERIIPRDTVLLCCTASIGEYAYTKIELTTNQQFNALVIKNEYLKLVCSMYLYEYVQTLKTLLLQNCGKTTFNFLSVGKLMQFIIPIPPLAEQKRIVAKIEEILPYIEQYDKAYTKLETFNKKFPSDMKKSILQLAMQGKLVEQRPEEGTAEELYQQIVAEKSRLIKEGKIKKEKPLAEITDDEIPFEIPESWKWVRLNDLCEKIGSGSTPTGGKNVYKESGIKFLRSQNVYNDGLRYEGIVYISEEQNKASSVVKAKDILLNITGGSIGRCVIVPDDFDIANINQHVMIIRSIELDLRFWLHNVIISAYIQNKIMDVQVGVSREGLSAEKLKNFLIPLPPLAEQKRIVAKLEQMLPYCYQLIK